MKAVNGHFDAVVVGSGPNGLAAAITMQRAGLSVLLIEGKDTVGGGMRTASLTLPGFHHDVCSAVHPMGAASPFLSSLPLHQHGLEFIQPELPLAHPFDDGTAACLSTSLEETAIAFGVDKQAYLQLVGPLVHNWNQLIADILAPLQLPKYPIAFAQFGMKAVQSAARLARRFSTMQLRGLWAGLAAHGMQPLDHLTTGAIGMVLGAAAHTHGWPIARGGSQSIANAMLAYFQSLGGQLITGWMVDDLRELPPTALSLLDLTPKQVMKVAGPELSPMYRWQMNRYQYGPGIFKIDWALSEPIPFKSAEARRAGTVHLGNSFEEIAAAEKAANHGKLVEKPFVLLSQPSLFDPSRAPEGRHTAWAYCHVPSGSTVNRVSAIEQQVGRFAPGFCDVILERHTMNAGEMQRYNPNYIGGDINGGVLNISQLYTRPAFKVSPYRTSKRGLYICSSSTPPGGGVHGMCGYHAARKAMQDVFSI